MSKKIAVIGGDMRQIYLVRSLKKYGYSVKCFGFDKTDVECEKTLCDTVFGCETVILPLPATTDGIYINMPLSDEKVTVEETVRLSSDCGSVLGGRLDGIKGLFKAKTVDYIDREEVAVKNAIPTAEGAIQIAMNELPITVFGMNCLVTGFGRVSRALCSRLKALGAKVTVAARKISDLAWIEEGGFVPLPFSRLSLSLSEFDCIFNTVPQKVFNRPELLNISPDAIIVDLASKPGGVDLDEALLQNKKVIWALSLPGKVAAKTSGEIIAKTVIHILEEEL
ncbi:MAG: dipicolinate synthase subunit DpsA [Clostridia bacterium]|nr:dipicolinate synthase subunit DpsA [Clostridia bacterium]